MELQGLHFPDDALAAFCRHYQVARLSLFGSILKSNFGPESDVDILVEFLPGHTPGMFVYGQMIIELSKMIGRQVDLRTPDDLSRYFRDDVVRHARLLHAA